MSVQVHNKHKHNHNQHNHNHNQHNQHHNTPKRTFSEYNSGSSSPSPSSTEKSEKKLKQTHPPQLDPPLPGSITSSFTSSSLSENMTEFCLKTERNIDVNLFFCENSTLDQQQRTVDSLADFAMLSLEKQLYWVLQSMQLTDGLCSPVEVVRMFRLFNQINHHQVQQEVWNSPFCGDNVLISKLLSTLKISSCPEYLVEGFHFLGLLSRSTGGRDSILAAGGLNIILEKLKSASGSGRGSVKESLFRFICFSLGNLLSGMVDDEEGSFRQMIISERIIPIMIEVLEFTLKCNDQTNSNGIPLGNNNCWEVIQQICFAIGNIAFISDFEDVILECNGIPLVLEVIKKSNGPSYLNKNNKKQHVPYEIVNLMIDSVFFLKNLAVGEGGRTTMIKNGGIPEILAVMKNHPHHSELQELSINLLFDLSFSGASQLLENSTAIELILIAMKNFENNHSLLKEALKTISRFYTTCQPEQKKMIIRAGTPYLLRLIYINNKNYLNYSQSNVNPHQHHQHHSRQQGGGLTTKSASHLALNSNNKYPSVSPSNAKAVPLVLAQSPTVHVPQLPLLSFPTGQAPPFTALPSVQSPAVPAVPSNIPLPLSKSTPETLSATAPSPKPSASPKPINHYQSILEMVLKLIVLFSREEIYHEEPPATPLPSLLEYSARCIQRCALPYTPQSLPTHLHSLLSTNRSKCDYCGHPYLQHYYQLIAPARFPEFRYSVPVFWKVCSDVCYLKVKGKRKN